jgi:uncharacterized protein (UPF0262 family)
MPTEIRLHGALWRQTPPGRADEWRRALDELNQFNGVLPRQPTGSTEAPALEFALRPDDVWEVRFYADGVRRTDTLELPPVMVAEHVAEYTATISQLAHVDREAPVRGFEALDYAKRVVHDDAAAALKDALASVVRMDLADARRIFTLFFLLATDLPEELVRYHRFHR